MLRLLRLCWPICRLQGGPQDLPWSPGLLLLAALAHTLAQTLAFSQRLPLPNAMAQALVAIALSLGVWSLLLWLRGKSARSVQTLTALQACGTLFALMLLLVSLLGKVLGAPSAGLGLTTLLLTAWNLSVVVHILRQALDCPAWQAWLWTLLVVIGRLLIMQALFPVALPA